MALPRSAPALRPRVLVCDDSRSIRALVASFLGPDYECLLVGNAGEALRRAPEFRPDLVISDVLMPGVDGYELCRRWRSDPQLGNVPFIFLTSATASEERSRGLELGADDYLTKPVQPRELLARVGSLLRLRWALCDLERRSRELEEANRTLAELQASLVRAEKLAAVTTLVAGVAHSLGSPLACVKAGAAALEALVADLEAGLGEALRNVPEASKQQAIRTACDGALAEIREVTSDVAAGAGRIERITSDLRAFALGASAEREQLDLAAEVDRAWRFARLAVSPAPALALHAVPLPPVHSSGHLVSQVLRNVLRNAVEAAGAGGSVRVSLAGAEAGVVVEVRDSGPGIRPEHMPRIFDPFFTTKGLQDGRGLGLSVAYGIVRSLGGRIEAASPPGEGATFRVWLPRRAPGSDHLELAASLPAASPPR
jgi:signal transduction histidine kinase